MLELNNDSEVLLLSEHSQMYHLHITELILCLPNECTKEVKDWTLVGHHTAEITQGNHEKNRQGQLSETKHFHYTGEKSKGHCGIEGVLSVTQNSLASRAVTLGSLFK